jgi:hypothetical protein
MREPGAWSNILCGGSDRKKVRKVKRIEYSNLMAYSWLIKKIHPNHFMKYLMEKLFSELKSKCQDARILSLWISSKINSPIC